jgi:hypothetical protein
MHILCGFFANINNGTTYGAVTAAVDQAMTKGQNSGYIMPAKWRCLRAWGNGVNLTALQLYAPSLRNLAYPELYPVQVGATVPSRPPIVDFREYAPFVQQNEEVGVNASVGGAAASDNWAGLWLSDKFTPAPGGPAFSIPYTATITAIKGQWVLGSIVLGVTLPAGTYAVIGMTCVAANTLFARLVFPGNSQWRPGCIVDNTYGNFESWPNFRYGGMGLFGSFVQTAQPQLEIFGLAAGAAAPAGVLDLIKTG